MKIDKTFASTLCRRKNTIVFQNLQIISRHMNICHSLEWPIFRHTIDPNSLSVCVFVCLCVCVFVCLSVCVFVCLSVCPI